MGRRKIKKEEKQENSIKEMQNSLPPPLHPSETFFPPKQTNSIIIEQLNGNRTKLTLSEDLEKNINSELDYKIDKEDAEHLKIAFELLRDFEKTENSDFPSIIGCPEDDLRLIQLVLKDLHWVDNFNDVMSTDDFMKKEYFPTLKKHISGAYTYGSHMSCLDKLLDTSANNNNNNNNNKPQEETTLRMSYSHYMKQKNENTFAIKNRQSIEEAVRFHIMQHETELKNAKLKPISRRERRRNINYYQSQTTFNRYHQMKKNRRALIFSRSAIHNWGLYALEDIPANEMIVEYTGEKIRASVADERERRSGPDASSYFFRIDSEWVIDATNYGNCARFINHSCSPNCYARIIDVSGELRIIIFSKIYIRKGTELTYDYKFPLEDVKIPCHCGSKRCRKYLN